VQQKNRLEQKGLLTRFSITCYGHQESVEEMRADKAAKYKEIKQKNDKGMLEEWFLNYKPDDFKNKKSDDNKPYKSDYKKKYHKSKRARTNKRKKPLAIYGGKTRRSR
jgi:hypothetical protein